MKFYVDRIEDNTVVLESENRDLEKVDADILPENIREGSILYYEDGKYSLDPGYERSRRRRLFLLQERLKRKNDRKRDT